MRILVTGATGFIGSAVLARLDREGFETVAVARPGSTAPRGPATRWVELDFARATAAGWRSPLEGVDAVVNCAGVFADSFRESTRAVHVDGAFALFQGTLEAGVRRIVHISAFGAADELTVFGRTKFEAERALAQFDLDWVILRPSLVAGAAAWGGGALMRGFAALPVFPEDQRAGLIQVVQLDDLVSAILCFLNPGAPARIALDIVGPAPMSLARIAATYRSWLGWRPARIMRAPEWLMRCVCTMGDIAHGLGWRTPISTAGRRELERGAAGDPAPWSAVTGITPQSLERALAARPASVQERRFAQLYFVKPLVFMALSIFWIGTGVASLTFGHQAGVDMLRDTVMGPFAGPSVIAGGIADLAIGAGIAFRPAARAALWAALTVCAIYAILGTVATPRLWLDPLAPLLKIAPLMALNVVALAMARDR